MASSCALRLGAAERYGRPMSDALPALVTEAEFLALPASMTQTELLDGEVIVSPAPTFRHQDVLRRLVVALSAWADAAEDVHVVGQAPVDIRFGPGRILQPDAFVIRGSVDLDRDGPLEQVPMLCIEVLSRDRVYDRVTKRLVYATAGVEEYWTVDPAGAIERWIGDGLARRDVLTDVLASPRLPGFSLKIGSLFPR